MVGGANAQDPQGWKRPWELWGGVWLRLKEQKGPGVPPTPGLRGRGTSPGSPAGFLGSSGWGKRPTLLSRSSQRATSPPHRLPLLISPASLLCPQDQCGRQGRVGLGGEGTGLGAQQAPRARVGRAITLCSSPTPPGGPLPPASPNLPGLPPMLPGPTQPGGGFGW